MKINPFYLIAGTGLLLYFFVDKSKGKNKKNGGYLKYRSLVDQYSKKHGLRSAIVSAVIHQESGWNPRAYRAEPKVGDASRGLGQILLGTARQYGYKGTVEQLYNPEINIDWTAHILNSLWHKYRKNEDMFAAYNAGSVRKTKDGKYINQKYVDSVMRLYVEYLKK